MDPLDQGFLDSLRENPTDSTTRLVHADWLDERDDPRASFLREEVELVELPAGAGRACALRSRLGTAVADIDGNWLADVSLLGHHLFERWRGLEKSFVRYDEDRQSIIRSRRRAQWQTVVTELGSRFADCWPASTGGRFQIPLDYTMFQILIGSGWFRQGGPGEELRILSIDSVRYRSEFWLEWADGQPTGPSGSWLSVGEPWSNHREHHLCCDSFHPAFGAVYESDDDSGPWNLGVESMKLLAPSFRDYLGSIPR